MSSKYLSILFISEPVLAANNRGESDGNIQTLQKVTTPEGTRTILTGGALRYAIRQNIQDAGAPLWRRVVLPTVQNPVGFVYGPNDSPVMAAATAYPILADVDSSMGFMVAPKGNDVNAAKFPSQVLVSAAMSCSPYLYDVTFRQGHKADWGGDEDKTEGQTENKPKKASKDKLKVSVLNPFSQEQHWTRYQFLVTFNLKTIPKGHLPYYLDALKGLQVGGSHASNKTEIMPCVIAWRIHTVGGQSGLYLGNGWEASPDEPVNLSRLQERCRQLGITANLAGEGQSVTVAEALRQMMAEAASYMSDDPPVVLPVLTKKKGAEVDSTGDDE